MSDMTTLAENRAIGRRVLIELWSQGRLEVADDLYAPDYVDHVGRGPEPERVAGPEGIKRAVAMFRAAFPDLSYSIEAELAEGDLVVTRFFAQGTHLGPFLGAPPTGKKVSYGGMDLNRVVGGKIVESWVNYDALALLQQVGLVPSVKGL